MSDLSELQKSVIEFRDARGWKQFHNPKDLAISLQLEASEVLEHFQWKTPQEIQDHLAQNRSELAEELSDVLYWILLLGHDLKIDLVDSFKKKMLVNNEKYPVEKSSGNHKKYTEL